MPDLKTALKKKIKQAKRIAILGVGSDLRGDDAAGMLAAEALNSYKGRGIKKRFKVFLGSTAPENLTGEIKRFKPEYLIIIDSADFGAKLGQARLFGPEEINGVSFSTHKLPFEVMADYLSSSLDCGIVIIGIQVKNINFATLASAPIRKSAEAVSVAVLEALKA